MYLCTLLDGQATIATFYLDLETDKMYHVVLRYLIEL